MEKVSVRLATIRSRSVVLATDWFSLFDVLGFIVDGDGWSVDVSQERSRIWR